MSKIGWISKDDLTFKEYNSLCQTHGIFNGVNFSKVKYYRDQNSKIYELSFCIDGSLKNRLELLESIQKKKEIMKRLGF